MHTMHIMPHICTARWRQGLRTSAKRKTINFFRRSKMANSCFQEFCLALLSISLFEHVNPLRSSSGRVSECVYILIAICWRPQEEFVNITLGVGKLLLIDTDDNTTSHHLHVVGSSFINLCQGALNEEGQRGHR